MSAATAARRKIIIIGIIAIIIIGAIAAYFFILAPKKPKLRIFYNAGNTERERIATLLASEWGKLGFEVVVRAMEWPVYLDTIMDPEAFDVYIIGWAPDYIDPDDYATPMSYGGTHFKSLTTIEVATAADVANYLSSAKVFEVENSWYVVVGPKGTGATVNIPAGAKILVVQYEVDEEHTLPIEKSTPWITIDPAMYRNTTLDALIQAGVIDADVTHRAAIYQAVQQITNYEVPIIWLSQHMLVRNHWTWINGWYYHPVKPIRYDLLWEQPDTPSVRIGTLGGGVAGTPSVDYYNNRYVIAIATIGWPESFDGAFTYETFGWEILWEIGDQLVTYWKTETIHPDKDLAIAWARTEDASTYYFIIRGNVKAYNRWVSQISADEEFGGTTQELYDISALDVLFSIWRVGWLEGDPSWMVTAYISYNESKVLSESEFNDLLSTTPLIAEYKGQSKQVHNISELLEFFGSSGIPTAGVVELKLTMPYPAILPILADAFLAVVPMKYVFDAAKWDYSQALQDIEYGKKIFNLAKYINKTAYEEEKSHRLLHKYPIATGPFYIYDYKDNEFIILKKNPYYWNATLYVENPNYGTIDYVIYVIYNEPAPRLSLYKSGAVDFCYVPRENIPEVNGTTYPNKPYEIKIVASPDLLTFDIDFIVLNTYKYPLNITLVRQALTWAVPFEKIYKDVFEGLAVQLYGVIPKGMLGYTEKNIIKYTYNLTKAKELIEASGIFKTEAVAGSVIPIVPIVASPILIREEEE